MKLNWGVKIVLLYGTFVIIVLSMVAFFMTRDVDLVSNRYYDEGIGYQNKINEIERTKELSEQVNFTLKDSFIIIQFPQIMDNRRISGILLLYRPSDQKRDIRLPIKLNRSNQMVVTTSGLEKGVWKFKADWKFRDIKYYNEQTIQLQ